jgi:predicted RNA binding protein YcfA (HicA-like mRNA interferase family)
MVFLEGEGFAVVRIRGSHHVMARGALRTVVPVHGSQTVRTGTLRAILRDVEMSPVRFAELRDRAQ